jgi:hypothetical protein
VSEVAGRRRAQARDSPLVHAVWFSWLSPISSVAPLSLIVPQPLAVHNLSRLVMACDSRSYACGRRAPTQTSGAPMTYGCIEDLKFAVEVFDQGGNLREVLARSRDLDAAPLTTRAAPSIPNGCCIYASVGESCVAAIGRDGPRFGRNRLSTSASKARLSAICLLACSMMRKSLAAAIAACSTSEDIRASAARTAHCVLVIISECEESSIGKAPGFVFLSEFPALRF